MQVVFGEKQKITSTTTPLGGAFLVPPESLWISCREQFADKFKPDTKGFFFAHFNSNLDVASFINKIEDVIELEKKRLPDGLFYHEKSKYSETNLGSVIWVEPSDFWKQCEIRRSLFTLFLRCAQKYKLDSDNFDDALYSTNYVAMTKDAINRFLFGFTTFVKDEVALGSNRTTLKGWVNVFQHKSKNEVKKQLVASDNSEESLIDLNSLWS